MRRAIVASIACLAGIAGCSDSSGPSGPEPNQSRTSLTVNLTGMTPHIGQLVELRAVSSGNQLLGKAILAPLSSATTTVKLGHLLPEGSSRLDFYADLSGNNQYEAPPTDHAWRVTTPTNGTVDFSHNTTFTDISLPGVTSPGEDFVMNMTGFTPHVGSQFEVQVVDKGTGATVGLYRLGEIPAVSFSVSISGIIKDGSQYEVDFYADVNGNKTYDAPPTDHAWRLTQSATALGLTVSFAHNTSFTDVKM